MPELTVADRDIGLAEHLIAVHLTLHDACALRTLCGAGLTNLSWGAYPILHAGRHGRASELHRHRLGGAAVRVLGLRQVCD